MICHFKNMNDSKCRKYRNTLNDSFDLIANNSSFLHNIQNKNSIHPTQFIIPIKVYSKGCIQLYVYIFPRSTVTLNTKF